VDLDRTWLLVVLGLALEATGCSAAATPPPRFDIPPTSRLLARPLPDGVAETAFEMSSEGSGGTATRSSLTWIVAHESREYEYTVARCRELRLNDVEPRGIATALCDGMRYDVVVEPGRLELRRENEELTSFTLPAGMRVRAVTER
jgi:hypothetical protein